jgi:hypothetical protein
MFVEPLEVAISCTHTHRILLYSLGNLKRWIFRAVLKVDNVLAEAYYFAMLKQDEENFRKRSVSLDLNDLHFVQILRNDRDGPARSAVVQIRGGHGG